MKKWVLVLFMVILLSGCKGNKEVLTKLSEFPDNNFNISTIEKVDCYLGGGSVYSLSDASHIKDIYGGGNYYTVRERQKLRELMDRVRDYYQMEAEDGE